MSTRQKYMIACVIVFACILSIRVFADQDGSNVIAKILGNDITAADIHFSPDEPLICSAKTSCSTKNSLRELNDAIWSYVSRDFIKNNNLQATDEEIQEFADFQDRFMKQDRIRRKKKLEEIKIKLVGSDLNDTQRENLEKHKTTLESLAKHDERREKMNRNPTGEARAVHACWIENWKIRKAIFDKYGGIVAITKFGHNPVGAKKALLEDYQKQGSLMILNKKLNKAFWEMLSKKTRLVALPQDIDFTPYWKKPLPDEAGK